MAQYGYRIFKTTRMNGTGNTAVPFMDSTWGDFVDHLTRSYDRQRSIKWHENPKDAFDADGKPLPLDPNSRIVRLDWVVREGSSVFFAVSSGKNDGFRDAMTAAPGAADVSIEHLAPRRQYRGVYTLPPKETEGVLALEVISRSCPTKVLTRWSDQWSQDLMKADALDGKTSKHCRIRFKQLTDSAQVTDLLNNGDPQEIVLVEHEGANNGLPGGIQYRLSAPVRQKTPVMATVKNWIVGGNVTKQDGIREARALVGPELDNVEFDDCYVSVRHDGQVQHVGPDAYSELFTYDNGQNQRQTQAFFRRVNDKFASLGLARTMGLELKDWPSDLPELLEQTD